MKKRKIFGTKIEGHEYSTRYAVYAVIFNSTNHEVVTVQTPDAYYWLPGGRIEGNESHESCLKRELLEETGYDVEIGSFIGEAVQFINPSKHKYEHIKNIGHFYFAKLLTKVQEPTEDDHFFNWVSVKNIDEILYHQNQVWAVKEGVK